MTRLPAELARWESELASLPPELALAVTPWIGRLALAIGPWADARREGAGEPDGIGALARRGSYERLLASEWLLADEMPDEFLRRAACSEHLFLATVRRAPSASRQCIALFDAGPSQLGAARVAHVALLIVLARRARDAGARFAWGVLQHPASEGREGSDAGAVSALLDARVAREPSHACLDAWAEHVEAGEAWAISSPRTSSELAARGFRAITLDDPVVLDRCALSVRIGPRTLELPLPADEVCARLIRDPLRGAAPKPSTHGVPRAGAFGFVGGGRRLVVETSDGFLSWGVPNSPRGNAGSPKRLVLGPDERLVAAGHCRRKLIAIATTERDLVIYGAFDGPQDARGRARVVLRGGSSCEPAAVGEHGRALGSEPSSRKRLELGSVLISAPDLTWQSRDHRLFSLRPGASRPRERGGVIGCCATRDGLLIVECDAGGGVRVIVLLPDGTERVQRADLHVFATDALFGGHTQEAVAYNLGSDARAWRVLRVRSGPSSDLYPPEGFRVVGVHSDASRGPSLVVLEPGARTIALLGRASAPTVLTASAPIEHAVVASQGGMVAWRTAEGWIEVGSLHHEAIVMRVPKEKDA